MKTSAQLRIMMRKLRAQGAREYSTREEFRRMYRDGFTDGWAERDAVAIAERADSEDWDDSTGARMLH